jgi:hypothetical protein
MKNKQKPLLSRGAIGTIFAIVALVTLSGYDITPVVSQTRDLSGTQGSDKNTIKPSLVLAWSLPSVSISSVYAKDTGVKQGLKEVISDSLVLKKNNPKPVVKKIGSAPLPLVSVAEVSFKPIPDQSTEGPVIPELTDNEKAAKIRTYFSKYNLPLANNAEKFVEVSHYCDIDWTLLPAIGMRESTGGKFTQLNNPFGWASARIGFKDFDEAIEVVGGHLCGLYDSTDQYYKDKTTAQKLWYYNASVHPRYTGEVVAIMNKIKSIPITTPLAME